ncbi:putative cyclin [Rosa chinensis]|uniref:B-like cyclin n=1 Tax=Rosa chinensis TaxID=74649 RepID=A0A2P6QGD6_ROSCH|nr:putative cyclin [Rosa chinensis]
MQLLVVACLSLAAKMEEINVPISLDLQELTSWNLNIKMLQ